MAIELTSSAFQEGQPIPQRYTGDGQNVSPPLAWRNAPEGTKSFALICEDPDAPKKTWSHWVLFNLPGETRELGEGISREATLPSEAAQGKNDFGKLGYGGPAPPAGKPHRYFFRLYALDNYLGIKAGTTRDELLKEMKGHILDEGQLLGTYGR